MSQPIVLVKNGKIGGKIAKDYYGDNYYSFQGIPYAKPPVGPLRFKAPLPADNWEGVKDATTEGNDCISYNPLLKTSKGSDDCLYLNVYTRELPTEATVIKPVMVWIHGGAFTTGSGRTDMHGPEYLITKDVVLVVLNYRVGILGFLNLEDPSLGVPGNAGLKDQILALKWVQENISQFSGDQNNVTLFGISAGAASVHYLMLSPLTKGLFHKCILQSGCALAPWTKGHRTLPYLNQVIETKKNSEKELLDILEKLSLEEIVDLQNRIKEDFDASYKRCFAPVVEIASPGAVFTEDPQEIIRSGNYNPVPMIIGFTSKEGTIADLFCDGRNCEYRVDDFETKIPHTLSIDKGSESSKSIARKIKNYYYGKEQPCQENKNQYYLMQGDSTFTWPIIMTVKYHSASSTTPIYLYEFCVEGTLNFFKNIFKFDTTGAAHGDDGGYLFKNITTPSIIPNSIEDKTVKRLVTLWTNFACCGNPNPPQLNSLINIQWKPVEENILHFLQIGENVTQNQFKVRNNTSYPITNEEQRNLIKRQIMIAIDTLNTMSKPVVTLKNGKILGKIAKDYDGGEYYSFRGIPYAKPPIGSLRFKAPLPAEPWEGIKDATEDGNYCLMSNVWSTISGPPGSEDCLILNVYTRKLPDESTSLKPVIFWIHGGAFTVGNGNSSTHGPELLITKDIVLVTINYRLGLLGFLSFDDPSLNVPGNAGLKDQVMALKWVQENIKNFNGDPNNVTVSGLSAGGSSVHYLMLSPLTKGLFHKCIIQSGSALCPWSQGWKSLPYLVKALESKFTSEKEILDVLEKMSGEELMKLQEKIPDNVGASFKRCFAPVVEYKSPSAFITESPEVIITSGNFHKVPFIIGFTSREGCVAEYFPNESKNGYVVDDFESKIPFTLNVEKGSDLSKNIANKIKNYYYGSHSPCKENKDQFYMLEGDCILQWPVIKTVQEHSAVSDVPIYLYRVSVQTDLDFCKQILGIKTLGVPHGNDLAYLFQTYMLPIIKSKTVEEKTMRRFVNMWTNFATSGNPNYPKIETFSKIEWKPIERDDLHYIEIGENLTFGINPDQDRMKFWNEVCSEIIKFKLNAK
ncbi:hypothetical protein FQR65_LT09433 [Abscondita terminalis]|nr:hypothetical protein FQR65_LT09433 [Abscondita terminalis]